MGRGGGGGSVPTQRKIFPKRPPERGEELPAERCVLEGSMDDDSQKDMVADCSNRDIEKADQHFCTGP